MDTSAEVVAQILAGDPAGLEALYELSKRFEFFLLRQLGHDDLRDHIHNVFTITATQIAAGNLRDPTRLIPFVTTCVRFYRYMQINKRSRWRRLEEQLSPEAWNAPDYRANVDKIVYRLEVRGLTNLVIGELKPRDAEVLIRFYVQEQSKETIMQEMQFTPTQFRLIKGRALARARDIAADKGIRL